MQRCGIESEIVERAENWNHQGYSIGLWSNGRKMLQKLGLEERFDERGTRIKHFVVHDGSGKLLKKYDLDDFYRTYGTGYVHIDRAELHDWLLERAGAERVKMGTTVSSLSEAGSGVTVTLSDGSSGMYDLVVAADGVHSQVRKLAFGLEDFEHFTEWRVWYAWINQKYRTKGSVVQYVEAEQYVSVFDDGDKTMCVLLAPVPHGTWDEIAGRVERIKKIFKDCSAVVPSILEGVRDADMVPTDLASVSMKRWCKGRVVLLGDAAHAMEPFAGIGGSMAMEDAYVLAGEVLRAQQESRSIESALRSYEDLRKARVSEARAVTGGMRWWSLVRSPLLRKLFNVVGRRLPVTLFTRRFHLLLSREI